MDYTDKKKSVKFDNSDIGFFQEKINMLNEFTGGPLISVTNTKLNIKNSKFKKIHTT